MPRASARKSPAASRHAETVRVIFFEAQPAGLTFDRLVGSSALNPSQARSGLACLRDTITEHGWLPLIGARADGYRFCSDAAELQAYKSR
ncbi:hypothetical protein [Streptomyces sp. NPDC058701]|uniref:hypothetical protein n=1 Tax=Streptomyces sp. NPDC058701 TaxID=3346608 RepID=UPI00364610AE